ncbi:MAG: Spy/CpxP family protein refolding chaperone [Pyrinomonadaceae bacterium]
MSLKFKFISTLTVAGLIAAFSSVSTAQDTKADAPSTAPNKAEKPFKGHRGGFGKFGGKGVGGKKHGRHGMRGFMRGIDLTDAQKEQIRGIREANKPDQAKMDEIRTLIEAKRAGTLTADQEARFKSFRDERQAKSKAVHEQMINVLTAEQKAQIEKNKQEMKQRHEQFRQKREELRKQKQDGTGDKPKVG